MCDTVARCEHVSRDQDTHPSFVTSAATHPRQPATVASGEYIFVGQIIFHMHTDDFSRKNQLPRDGKYCEIALILQCLIADGMVDILRPLFQAYSISPGLKESPPVSPPVLHSEAEVEVVITEKCKS